MRKISLYALILSAIYMIAVGCSIQASSGISSFSIVQHDRIPQAISDFLAQNKHYETAAVFKDDKYMYFVINRGVMPTDGYDVAITDIHKAEDYTSAIDVEVAYTNPSWDQEVHNVLTYPFCVAKIAIMDTPVSIIRFIEDERLIASLKEEDIIPIK